MRSAGSPFRNTPRPATAAVALVLAFGLSACAMGPGDGRLGYVAPRASDTSGVGIEAQSPAEAARLVAERLRAGGLTVTSVRPASGRVAARASDASLVDCGSFLQRAYGNTSRFAATAPLAVVFADDQPGGMVRREARVASRVHLSTGDGSVRIAERHRVTLRQLSADGGRVLWSETRDFTESGPVRFSDGTTCLSSGRVAALLR
ncbi:hypothetical protein [Rhodovulum euryhalinum]|uniref:Uncharacterized protein n=1 Tax=Rhodovulum euryhalinum TaxID=35805 RepID=A0A4R2KEI6_9RHOB|nr:hypothetical protein [Rhodovulum euryhalinum]TCO72041.1 hypothetical protein EV655_105147 [Rhodovulum euryhalinum]